MPTLSKNTGVDLSLPATLYSETYSLKGAPVFMCYYIFTASVMHVTSSAYLLLGKHNQN